MSLLDRFKSIFKSDSAPAESAYTHQKTQSDTTSSPNQEQQGHENLKELDAMLSKLKINSLLIKPDSVYGRDQLDAMIEEVEEYQFLHDCNYPQLQFTLAFAYMWRGKEYKALPLFRAAFQNGFDEEDVQPYIAQCEKKLMLPVFDQPFAKRVEEAWDTFEEQEDQLRAKYEYFKRTGDNSAINAHMCSITKIALSYLDMELTRDDTRYVIIMYCHDDPVNLYRLNYFVNQMPSKLRQKWVFHPALPRDAVVINTPKGKVSGADIQTWIEWTDKAQRRFKLYCYNPTISEVIEDSDILILMHRATFRDAITKTLGEVFKMRYVSEIVILDHPWKDVDECPPMSLEELPHKLSQYGVQASISVSNYSQYADERYKGRNGHNEPGDYRYDIILGSTCCRDLVDSYFNEESNEIVDLLHDDGIAAGFIMIDVAALYQAGRVDEIEKMQLDLMGFLTATCGEKVLRVIGKAIGSEYCYIDFIAWDLVTTLTAASTFCMLSNNIERASFHSFRKTTGTIDLKI